MPRLKCPIHALPGFLGTAGDWGRALRGLGSIIHHPFFTSEQQLPFWEWAKCFNGQATNHGVLAGYSLGGRLALHAALLNPERWKGLIIVSSHPGLKDPLEKEGRVHYDQHWAMRFRSENWQDLMHAWNKQEVFASPTLPPIRKESEYSRNALEGALSEWSLGKQECLHGRICALNIPILWVVGENDQKFLSIAQNLTFSHESSKIWIAPKAGHRVIFDAAESLNQQVKNFIFTLG